MADVLHARISTYAPMSDGGRYVAIIDGFPMHFFGATAVRAYRLADDFRLRNALALRGADKFPPDLLSKAVAATARHKAETEG